MSTYYVDATLGVDSNDGLSPANAWKTPPKVDGFGFSSGDIVSFKRGEVFDSQGFNSTFKGGITYQDYGNGNLPVIEGSKVFTGWVLDSGTRFKVTCTIADGSNFMVWEDGIKGTKKGSQAAVTSPRDFFLDDTGDLLYYISSDSADPDTHRMNVDQATIPIVIQAPSSNGVIRNITVRMSGDSNVILNQFGSVATNWLIESCRFSQSNSHAVAQFGGGSGSSYTLRSCEIDSAALMGISMNATTGVSNTLIQDCSVHDNVQHGASIWGPVTNSGIIVRNSNFYNNGQDGLGVGSASAPAYGALVEGCIAHNNGTLVNDRTGIKTFGKNIRMTRCSSYNNNLGFSGHGFQLDTAADDCQIDYCVSYGNSHSGISVTGKNHRIYNNVCSGNSARGLTFFGADGSVDNCTVRNNILYDNGSNAVQLDGLVGALTGETGMSLDYNLYYDPDAHTNLISWKGTNYATLAAFVAATPHEDHGVEADPLFVGAAGGNFRLKPGSPCIGAGTPVGLIRDIDGNPVPWNGPVDIGAYEWLTDSALIRITIQRG